MAESRPGKHRATLGGHKGYYVHHFIAELRGMAITPLLRKLRHCGLERVGCVHAHGGNL